MASMKKKIDFFDIVNYVFLVIIAVIMLYPFVNAIAISFSTYDGYLKNPFMVITTEWSLEGFKYVFKNGLIMRSYGNTVFVVVSATLLGLFFTIIMAYPLSKRNLRGKKVFMYLLIFTMMFNGGLIPNFYLIKSLGWLDKYWALIIPGALGAYNVILMKSFFEGIPSSLVEAAKIDGASDITVLVKIMLPLSTPIIATIALFIAVGQWNNFFNALIYMRSPQKWTLQLVLREILMSAQTQLLSVAGDTANLNTIPPETLRYATLVVSVVPIMCVYPFLQKYFVQGITLGAVKG
ncbi:MAG: carbohydrate ABC transporter permease [Clostridiales bacterium]|nr:carbohydrate ABC transporter permease [Clostridiales bacterium]